MSKIKNKINYNRKKWKTYKLFYESLNPFKEAKIIDAFLDGYVYGVNILRERMNEKR